MRGMHRCKEEALDLCDAPTPAVSVSRALRQRYLRFISRPAAAAPPLPVAPSAGEALLQWQRKAAPEPGAAALLCALFEAFCVRHGRALAAAAFTASDAVQGPPRSANAGFLAARDVAVAAVLLRNPGRFGFASVVSPDALLCFTLRLAADAGASMCRWLGDAGPDLAPPVVLHSALLRCCASDLLSFLDVGFAPFFVHQRHNPNHPIMRQVDGMFAAVRRAWTAAAPATAASTPDRSQVATGRREGVDGAASNSESVQPATRLRASKGTLDPRNDDVPLREFAMVVARRSAFTGAASGGAHSACVPVPSQSAAPGAQSVVRSYTGKHRPSQPMKRKRALPAQPKRVVRGSGAAAAAAAARRQVERALGSSSSSEDSSSEDSSGGSSSEDGSSGSEVDGKSRRREVKRSLPLVAGDDVLRFLCSLHKSFGGGHCVRCLP